MVEVDNPSTSSLRLNLDVTVAGATALRRRSDRDARGFGGELSTAVGRSGI
jgi:hypothetical protein